MMPDKDCPICYGTGNYFNELNKETLEPCHVCKPKTFKRWLRDVRRLSYMKGVVYDL